MSPCSDGQDHHDRQISKARLDLATRLLCGVLGELERQGIMPKGDHELDAWWAEHKRKDAERLASVRALEERQRKREIARAKLTPEERKLLRVE